MGARLQVLQNRVTRHALDEVGLGELGEHISGPSAVAFGGEGAPAISKVLVDWERKLPKGLSIRAAYLDGRVLGVEDVRHLATIPDKPTLYALLASAVVAPVTQIAGQLSEILAGVARGVGALADQRREAE
jgi:large subunit ribosomal protein L10